MTQLPVKPGIDGLPTATIPTDPAAFIDWFKNSYLPRWAANADIRNATAGTGVQISGNPQTPGFVGFEEISGTSVLGNPTGADGDVQAITASANGQFLQRSAGSLVFAPISVADSITGSGIAASPLELVNDSASPGASQVYGTNTAGVKGWQGLTGGSPFNVTPDTHGALPTGIGVGPNDEFEIGTSIDTAGTRYAGATPWSAFNLGSGSTVINQGSLLFIPTVSAPVNYSGYVQAVPSGSWEYTAKIAVAPASNAPVGGMLLSTAAGASGHLYMLGISVGTVAVGIITAQRATTATSFATAVGTGATSGGTSGGSIGTTTPLTGVSTTFVYLKMQFNGTNIIFSVSSCGVPGSFMTVLSETAATFIGVPGLIGLGMESQGSLPTQLFADWFRRTA